MCFFKYHVDTFGVESVVITDTTGGRVCLECSFSSFSTDTGCTVELVSCDSSSSVQYTETINRSGNGTAEGCVSGITRGQYNINVYDQSSHMLFETFTRVNVTGETATTTTTPTGRTTTSTITTSTLGTRDSTNIIAGNVHNLSLFCFNFEDYTCSINKIFYLDSNNYGLHDCIYRLHASSLMNYTGKFYICLYISLLHYYLYYYYLLCICCMLDDNLQFY